MSDTHTQAAPEAATIKALTNGRLVELDSRGRATFLTCGWLVEVPSGNPEPDSLADCYRPVECGAPLFHPAHVGIAVGDGWECEYGHHHYGIEREWAMDAAREAAERATGGGW